MVQGRRCLARGLDEAEQLHLLPSDEVLSRLGSGTISGKPALAVVPPDDGRTWRS
jgi:hypothetical protein